MFDLMTPVIWGICSREEVAKMSRDEFMLASRVANMKKEGLFDLIKNAVHAGIYEAFEGGKEGNK